MVRIFTPQEAQAIVTGARRWAVRSERFQLAPEVVAAATEAGFAVFREEPAAAEIPGEDEIFGFGVTYGEYWAHFPEERPVAREAPEQNWPYSLLMLLETGWTTWYGPDGEPLERLSGSVYDGLNDKWLPALLLTENDLDGEVELRELTRLDAAGGWRFGGEQRVESLPAPKGALRLWDWAWPRTAGPAILRLELERTLPELNEWFEGLAIGEWRCHLGVAVPGRSREEERVFLATQYLREDERRFRLAGEGSGTNLYFGDGELELLHGREFAPHQPATDSTILQSVLAGDAGPVGAWRLIDGDYISVNLAARGTGSLREYLDPNLPEVEIRRRLRMWNVTLWPKQTGEIHAFLEEFRCALGLAPGETVSDWIRRTPTLDLPVEVVVGWNTRRPPCADVQEYLGRLAEDTRSAVRFRTFHAFNTPERSC